MTSDGGSANLSEPVSYRQLSGNRKLSSWDGVQHKTARNLLKTLQNYTSCLNLMSLKSAVKSVDVPLQYCYQYFQV